MSQQLRAITRTILEKAPDDYRGRFIARFLEGRPLRSGQLMDADGRTCLLGSGLAGPVEEEDSSTAFYSSLFPWLTTAETDAAWRTWDNYPNYEYPDTEVGRQIVVEVIKEYMRERLEEEIPEGELVLI